jgi:hypothetical protein
LIGKFLLGLLLFQGVGGHGGFGGKASVGGGVSSGGCALPFTDSLSGTGALGPCYTIATASGYGTLSRLSGAVVPAANGKGIAILAGATFSATQSSQIVIAADPADGGATGPIVRGDLSGNGYLWITNINAVIVINGGAGGATVINTCPNVAVGDTVKLSASGSTITCVNVTTSSSPVNGTDSTFASGKAGFLVDQTATGSTTRINAFVAN